MDPYANNQGAAPTVGADPNPTRYIPPEERYSVPQPGPAAAPTSPQHAPAGHAQMHPHAGHAHGHQYGRRDRERTILALVLIGGGTLFLLDQLNLFGGFDNLILLMIGGIFLYAYFSTKPAYRIGFLIPGSILTGLGVGEVLQEFPGPLFLDRGDITTLTLGLGFCLIWFLERRHWWALIPGGILVMSGMSSLRVFGTLWPLALIALGVYLLYGQSRRRVG